MASILRDVFRHPSYAAAGEPDRPAWHALTVAALVTAAYEERQLPNGHLDPARLAVLSDALEEAGVTGEVLDHLRSPGPHVRGCWALDLVGGRS